MRYQYVILILIVSGTVRECRGNYSKDFHNIPSNVVFEVKDFYDLDGKVIELPPGVTLSARGGSIRNGTLVGSETRIIGCGRLFDHVTIEGTWNVPYISTDLFVNLDYENSLRDVMELASPNIQNTVHIKKGRYKVSAELGGGALSLKSNTVLKFDGMIELIPNEHDIYYIIVADNVSNVLIEGDGVLIGDKNRHLGKDGEWGMGIHIVGSKNVTVSGLTIKECWGDCLYIGQESENIVIDRCKIENGRRQGLSITSATNVIVSNCEIKHIHGTMPEYAIDIEPNKFKDIEKVSISNVHIKDCGGGIMIYGNAKGASIKSVSISDCTVGGKIDRFPYLFSSAKDVTVVRCKSTSRVSTSLQASIIDNLEICENELSAISEDVIKVDKCNKIINRNNVVTKIR